MKKPDCKFIESGIEKIILKTFYGFIQIPLEQVPTQSAPQKVQPTIPTGNEGTVYPFCTS